MELIAIHVESIIFANFYTIMELNQFMGEWKKRERNAFKYVKIVLVLVVPSN